MRVDPERNGFKGLQRVLLFLSLLACVAGQLDDRGPQVVSDWNEQRWILGDNWGEEGFPGGGNQLIDIVDDAPPGYGPSSLGCSDTRSFITFLPLSVVGKNITFDDILSISWWTKTAANEADGTEWFMSGYAEYFDGAPVNAKDPADNPYPWYGFRFNLIPKQSINKDNPADQWVKWSTAAGANQLQPKIFCKGSKIDACDQEGTLNSWDDFVKLELDSGTGHTAGKVRIGTFPVFRLTLLVNSGEFTGTCLDPSINQGDCNGGTATWNGTGCIYSGTGYNNAPDCRANNPGNTVFIMDRSPPFEGYLDGLELVLKDGTRSDVNMDADSDGDGLGNGIEEILGTDPNVPNPVQLQEFFEKYPNGVEPEGGVKGPILGSVFPGGCSPDECLGYFRRCVLARQFAITQLNIRSTTFSKFRPSCRRASRRFFLNRCPWYGTDGFGADVAGFQMSRELSEVLRSCAADQSVFGQYD
jgi:hypothetical protein